MKFTEGRGQKTGIDWGVRFLAYKSLIICSLDAETRKNRGDKWMTDTINCIRRFVFGDSADAHNTGGDRSASESALDNLHLAMCYENEDYENEDYENEEDVHSRDNQNRGWDGVGDSGHYDSANGTENHRNGDNSIGDHSNNHRSDSDSEIRSIDNSGDNETEYHGNHRTDDNNKNRSISSNDTSEEGTVNSPSQSQQSNRASHKASMIIAKQKHVRNAVVAKSSSLRPSTRQAVSKDGSSKSELPKKPKKLPRGTKSSNHSISGKSIIGGKARKDKKDNSAAEGNGDKLESEPRKKRKVRH